MTTPLLLFATAALIGGVAGYPLARARWVVRAPRLAVALWHALCFGVVTSILLGGLLLTLSALPALPQVFSDDVSDFLARCAIALRAQSSAPHPAILGSIGMLLVVATLGRGLGRLVAEARNARRVRLAQLEVLALAGHRLAGPGEVVVVLDDARPAAYCLPGVRGGRGTIVVSSGALDVLDDDQVRLVLAHERAHLQQRHHLVTRLSATLAGAFGRVPLFRSAALQVPGLLEMAADDQSMRTLARALPADPSGDPRRRLALALLALATAQNRTPAGALAAADSSAIARVRRLSQPSVRLGAPRATLLGGGIVVAVAGPMLVASAPALCAAVMQICTLALS